MIVVKALVNATAPDFPGRNVTWIPGQTRNVDESLIEQYRNNPLAWQIVATPSSAPVSAQPNTPYVMVKLTQAAYNALTPDANTLYLIVG